MVLGQFVVLRLELVRKLRRIANIVFFVDTRLRRGFAFNVTTNMSARAVGVVRYFAIAASEENYIGVMRLYSTELLRMRLPFLLVA